MKVPRTVFFTPEQYEWLKQRSRESGIPVAELVRRSIEAARLRQDAIATPPTFGESA